jgi:hypothetical protein
MYMTARMSAAMKGTRMRELRALGYTSDVFVTKWKGGTCGLTGVAIPRGAHVAYFRDKGLCLAPAIEDVLHHEKRAAMPKCGCGKPVENERNGCCLRCGFVAETWFDVEYSEVAR